MKKAKKVFLIIIGILVVAVIVGFYIINSIGNKTTNEKIQVVQENISASVSSNLQDVEPVFIKNSIIINSKKNFLLCTFQNRDNALTSIKRRDAEFLQLMKAKWNLDDLNSANWKDYKQKLLPFTTSKLPVDLGGDKYEKQRQEFEAFLGIYPNDEINKDTLKHVDFVNFLIGTKLFHQVSLDTITQNLPFNDPSIQESSNQ